MFIASWNVRTLRDNKGNPERRTAIIARVLKQNNISIAALSETRLADRGQLQEVEGGYTFYWIGRPENEKRESGVGFAIRNDLVQRLESLPVGITDRLMSLRIPVGKNKHATLLSCYAPTMDSSLEVKESFYCSLRTQLRQTSIHDKLYVMGDFNARVGNDTLSWNYVIGKHGIGKSNSNGLMLLSLCSEFDLLISNTVFQQPNRYKTSW